MSAKSKILRALGKPQKMLFDKVAEKTGVKKGKDAEETAHNLVDKAAKKLGLGDSTAANALKALGVAGLTVAGDPLNLVPGVGPAKRIAKLTQKGSKAASNTAKLANKASLPKGALSKAAPGVVRAEKTAELGRTLKTKPTNVAKAMKENDLAAQRERIRRVLKSEDRVEAAKKLSPDDKKAFRKALLKRKQEK